MLSVLGRWLETLHMFDANAAKSALRQRPLLQDGEGSWCEPQQLIRLDPRTPPLPMQLERAVYSPPKSKAARDFAAAHLPVEVLTPQVALAAVLDHVESAALGPGGSRRADVSAGAVAQRRLGHPRCRGQAPRARTCSGTGYRKSRRPGLHPCRKRVLRPAVDQQRDTRADVSPLSASGVPCRRPTGGTPSPTRAKGSSGPRWGSMTVRGVCAWRSWVPVPSGLGRR